MDDGHTIVAYNNTDATEGSRPRARQGANPFANPGEYIAHEYLTAAYFSYKGATEGSGSRTRQGSRPPAIQGEYITHKYLAICLLLHP
jgi:hypothetical protein